MLISWLDILSFSILPLYCVFVYIKSFFYKGD